MNESVVSYPLSFSDEQEVSLCDRENLDIDSMQTGYGNKLGGYMTWVVGHSGTIRLESE